MKSLEQVIQNKFLISKNYKRVYDYINLTNLSFDETTAFIIYDMECQNIIEFIKLVTPFICYISSLLKYEDSDTYIEDDNIVIIKLEFQEFQGEYILDMSKVNADNGIESIRECIEYFNDTGFYLSFTKKFDAYFIISNDSEEKDPYNKHINTKKTFKTEECLICTENKPYSVVVVI